MEEKKKNPEQEQEKLSYEKLKQTCGELYQANQKMYARIQQLQEKLDEMDFNRTSYFLQMLMKCLEHPEMHTDNFTKWAVENVESMLIAFAETMKEDLAPAEGDVKPVEEEAEQDASE